jgi:Ca2+-binding RTX toxin-like protein
VWWNPAANNGAGAAGEALLRAVDMLSAQMAELRTQGAVRPVFIWSQGEAEVINMGLAQNATATKELYKSNTLAVFNYLKDSLGQDIEFYIMKTGKLADTALHEFAPASQSMLETGLQRVQEAQAELSQANKFIKIAVDYSDLEMRNDVAPQGVVGDSNYGKGDVWHLTSEAYEVVGDRLGQFIAKDLGYGVHESNLDDLINGTAVADVLHGGNGNDVLNGWGGADTLYGDAGADTFQFAALSAFNTVDTIKDFVVSDNTGAALDKIDIGHLLLNYDPLTSAITDFLMMQTSGADTLVSVDRDGTSGVYTMAQIAKIQGSTGLEDEAALFAHGNILVS